MLGEVVVELVHTGRDLDVRIRGVDFLYVYYNYGTTYLGYAKVKCSGRAFIRLHVTAVS